MDLLLGLVADAANIGAGNKLNVLGVFHQIGATAVPVAHPSFALALEFQAKPYDKGKTLSVEIRLLDPDGKELVKIEGQVQIANGEPLEPIVPLCIAVNNQVFPKFGNYRFEVRVAGTRKGEIRMELIHLTQQQP